jgi:predicted RNA-binding protein with PIN domain
MTPTLYIVDGYNVLHLLFPGADREEIFARRDWLAEQLASFAATRDAQVLLVFDAHGRRRSESTRLKGTNVEVCFASGRYSADTLIARRIAEQAADVAVVVVSADQEVQRTASRAGVRRMTPRELGLDLQVTAEGVDYSSQASRMPSTLEDKVDPETLRKLEELRTEPD